jgi:hypothetical protein
MRHRVPDVPAVRQVVGPDRDVVQGYGLPGPNRERAGAEARAAADFRHLRRELARDQTRSKVWIPGSAAPTEPRGPPGLEPVRGVADRGAAVAARTFSARLTD